MSIPFPLDAYSAAVAYHAQALAPDDREAFTQAVYERLAEISELGPGIVSRICATVQARFIDAKVIGSGPRPSGCAAKYSRPNWGIDRSGRLRIRPE